MNKYFPFLLSFIVFIVSCGTYTLKPPKVETIAQESTVTIVENNVAICKAVSISPWLLVTAAHCGNQTIKYVEPDSNYTPMNAHAVITDSVNDVSIYQTETPRDHWVPLQQWSQPHDGDNVLAGGSWSTIKTTHWVGRSEEHGTLRLGIQVDTQAPKGHSGSALIDEYGVLIGICSGHETQTWQGIYVPSSIIISLLKATHK